MVRSIFLHRKYHAGSTAKIRNVASVVEKSPERPTDDKENLPTTFTTFDPSCSASHQDVDDNEDRAAVPAFVESLHTRLMQQTQAASFRANALQWQDYLLGLAVIVASVFYGRLYHEFPQLLDWRNPRNNDYRRMALYVSTIAIPAYLTLLRQWQQAIHNPLRHLKALTKTRFALESETFQFRARAGLYHTEKDFLGAFTLRIQAIYRSIESYLSVPRQVDDDSFWDPPSEEGVLPQQEAAQRPSPTPSPPPPSYDEWLQELPQGSFDPAHEQGGTAKESTPLLFWGEDQQHPDKTDLEQGSAMVAPSFATVAELIPTDDKRSQLSSQEYVRFRLEAQLHRCEQEFSQATCRHVFLQRSVQLLTLSTSVMSAFSMQWSVPIVLGVVTALTSLESGGGKWSTHAAAAQAALQTLTEVQQWWVSLPASDRELEAVRDRLVDTTERALARKVEALAS